MNELELIKRLTASLPVNAAVVTGAGDDCAVLDLGVPGRWVLFKTDAVVEGVHFTREAAPGQIGHKALARCLSDFAAMAGQPTAAVVTLGLPEPFDAEFLSALYAGMNGLATRYQVAIVGGETTANPERLFVSLAMLGTVEQAKCVRRTGAKPGDAVFVTGRLGGSLAGRHLEFEPRLVEADWLVEHVAVHAMIDLSDGLASDLRHLMEQAQVGAELRTASIPISPDAKRQARQEASGKTPLLAALTDGEDFELLFTVAAKEAVPLLDGWKRRFPDLPLTCIGRITAEPGLRLRDKDGLRPLTEHGYIHFT
jgi:thiamine-monophosphate kinase